MDGQLTWYVLTSNQRHNATDSVDCHILTSNAAFNVAARFGRKILAETADIPGMVQSVTHYVATRLVERERALADDTVSIGGTARRDLRAIARRRRWRLARAFLFGLIVGFGALFAALWIVASNLPK